MLLLSGCSANGTFLTVTLDSGQSLSAMSLSVEVMNAGMTGRLTIDKPVTIPPAQSFVLRLDGRSGKITVSVAANGVAGELARASGETQLVPGSTVSLPLVLSPVAGDLGSTMDLAVLDTATPPDLPAVDLYGAPATFLVTASATAVKEHEKIMLTLTARDAAGATLTTYVGKPSITSTWGDVNVLMGPTFTAGVGTAIVWLDRETNSTNGPAVITVQDGPASGSSSGIAVTAPPWARVDTTPVFTPEPSGAWDDSLVGHPSLVRANGGYILYYFGKNSAQTVAAEGRATSPDGAAWTRASSNPVLSPNIYGAYVALDGGRYVASYHATFSGGESDGFASSSDGITWTRSANPMVAQGVVPACPYLFEGAIVVDSPGHYIALARNLQGQPCYLRSDDGGATWPVSMIGTLKGLNAPNNYFVTAFLKEGTVYKLWYSDGNATAYYATSTDAINWVPSPSGTLSLVPWAVTWNEVTKQYDALINNNGFFRATRQ